MRKQEGQIVRIGKRWYVRYWERQNAGGIIERKRVTHAVGEVTTRGKRPPADIKDEAARHMAVVNQCYIPPERVICFADFVTGIYLPWVKDTKKPSTYKGYNDIWEHHVKSVSAVDRSNVKDIRTFTVQRWLNQIGQDKLSRNSLKRIQSVLSGIFKQAKRLGYYDGVNPVQDTAVNPHAAPPSETYAYSLEEVQSILSVLPEPAATCFAVASFAGLREGELSGLEWPDYRDGVLHVSRAVWNGQVVKPKTKHSEAPIPVIKQLADRLEMHRLRSGNPAQGPIFANSLGKPLSMDNVRTRGILPVLNRCVLCGLPNGKRHLKEDHGYERNPSIPQWHGWHAARRGLGSNLYRLGVPDKVIQAILRHSNVNITLSYYIKSVSSDVVAAMDKFEQELAVQ
ncbi:MAG TPA: tyrosine-type recombinase/integrase [Terriglobales bacterium]